MFAGSYCGGMGLVGWLLMITFWAALIGLVVWAITRLFPDRAPIPYSRDRRPPAPLSAGREDARRVLDERLATGQISPQTYRQARDQLTSTTAR